MKFMSAHQQVLLSILKDRVRHVTLYSMFQLKLVTMLFSRIGPSISKMDRQVFIFLNLFFHVEIAARIRQFI